MLSKYWLLSFNLLFDSSQNISNRMRSVDWGAQVIWCSITANNIYLCSVWHLGQRVQSLFHQTRESCFSWSESPLGAFWQTPSGVSCAFYWGVASVGQLYHKGLNRWSAAEMVGLLQGSLIATEDLWSSVRVTIGFLITSLTKALLPRLLSLAGQPGLGRDLVVPNFIKWRMMEATVFPRSVPRHNPVSELYGQFLQPHGLVSALTRTVNCGTLYRDVCTFPNHVQSIEYTTGGHQSSCRYISSMINGNRMHLSSKVQNTCSASQKFGHTYSFQGFSFVLLFSTL